MEQPADLPPPSSHPLLIYDGDCGFCRGRVARWRALTGNRAEYKSFQELAALPAGLNAEALRESVHWIEPSGAVYRGAAAVFRLQAHAGRKRWALWCYEHLPGAAPLCEAAYQTVARHRGAVTRAERLCIGDGAPQRSFLLARWVFLRLLGIIYLIAFASLGVQVIGLAGSKGILPAQEFLDRVYAQIGTEACWRLPTIAWWIGASDAALRWMCVAGCALAALAVLNIAPAIALLGAWALYLSLCGVCQVFLNYQWDALLLEAGLLAIVMAPWRIWPRLSSEPPPPRWTILLTWWLLFRLMFASGMVKLLSGDETWWNLTALAVHYETQPLPTPLAWYAHQLPAWFQRLSCAIMFVIELAVPFCILLPRKLRLAGFFPLVLLMALIALTGNYTFFNLLTAALCVLLLDDAFLSRLVSKRLAGRAARSGAERPWPIIQCVLTLPPAALLLAVSTLFFCQQMLGFRDLPDRLERGLQFVHASRSINTYGLFAAMTTRRPEIVIEGSNDGRQWLEYEFKWKPGDLARRPGWVAPHQPRLDWQMWFAALGSSWSRPVVHNLMVRLLEGVPQVLALLDRNPFPDSPPKYVRAMMYEYHFTDWQTGRREGTWWRRKLTGQYAQIISRR